MQTSESPTQPTMDSTISNLVSAFHIVRCAGATLLTQAMIHAQLLRLEWGEEKKRLLKMFIFTLFGFACLLCVMMFAGIVLLAYSWVTIYRIPTLIVVFLVYLAGIGVSWQKFRTLSAQSEQIFAASRDELAADLALIKSKL